MAKGDENIDTDEPIELIESWYQDKEGFYIQKFTVVKTGQIIERPTPFKEVPWHLSRWISQYELDQLEEKK